MTKIVTPQWNSIDRFCLTFAGGKFREVWEEPALMATPNPGYIFKFDADGYKPFVTRAVALDEGEVRLDVFLHPGASSVITIMLPDGNPAPGVAVGLVGLGTQLSLTPGGFARGNNQSPGSLIDTDDQGHFSLPPDDSISKVMAASASGYAEASTEALSMNPVMILQPWGRLEGTWLEKGLPATNRAILFQLGSGDRTSVSTDFDTYQVKTDAGGHFIFNQVPSGQHELVQLIEMQLPQAPLGKAWIHQPLTNVDIRAGDTTTITFNGP
jgi:hypothetical protein